MAVEEAKVAVGAVGDAVAAVTIRVAALRGAAMVDVWELGGTTAVDICRAVGVAAGNQRGGGFHHGANQIRAIVLRIAVIHMGDQMGRGREVIGDATIGGVGIRPASRRGTAWANAFGRRGGGHVAIGLHEIHPLGGLVFAKSNCIAIVLLIHAHAEDNLLQIVDAADGASLLTRFRKGRQQHGGQNGDDGDDHQEFDQGKMTVLFHGRFLFWLIG